MWRLKKTVICPICGESLELIGGWSRTPMLSHSGLDINKECHYSRMATNDELEGI